MAFLSNCMLFKSIFYPVCATIASTISSSDTIPLSIRTSPTFYPNLLSF